MTSGSLWCLPAWNEHRLFFRSELANGLDPAYTLAGRLGQNAGLTWGGTFSTIYDAPHFQLTNGLSMSTIQSRWQAAKDVLTGL